MKTCITGTRISKLTTLTAAPISRQRTHSGSAGRGGRERLPAARVRLTPESGTVSPAWSPPR